MLDLDALTTAAEGLDPLPASITRLAWLVHAPETDLAEIVDLIALDQGLSMAVLRAANSAGLSGARKITMVRDAVLRLGGGTVVSLAVGSRVRGHLSVALPAYHLAEGELWRHSVAAALAAEIGRGACRADVPAECFTAALLHDVGKLVLVRFLSPELEHALEAARDEGRLTGLEAEREVLGVHHGEIGELIAQRWKLPDSISMPLAAHHAPSEEDGPIADMVHVADVVATRIGAGCNDATDIDAAVMARLGLEPESIAALEQEVAASFETVMRRYEA